MAITLDYKVIDIHVHIMPLHMLNPTAAAAIKATQPDHDLIHGLNTDPDKLVAYMDARNIEWLRLINYLSPKVMGCTEETNDFSAS
jgi:hypothetical protein